MNRSELAVGESERALCLEICAGTARLDDSLNDFLGVIPVLVVELHEVNAEVSCDVSQGDEAGLVVHEANADANTAKASGTADTVEVGFGVAFGARHTFHWDVVVDHHGDGLHVDAASEDVGGYKDLSLAIAERVDDAITLNAFLCS